MVVSKLLFIVTLFLSLQVSASLTDHFKSLLDQDAHGKRIEGNQNCKKQLKLLSKEMVSNQISNETIPVNKKISLDDINSFEILSYETIGKNPTIYDVHFITGEMEDHFLVLRHESKKKIKRYGEYEVLSPPENFYLYLKCQKE